MQTVQTRVNREDYKPGARKLAFLLIASCCIFAAGEVSGQDFKAEVAACGLGADWGGARLEKLFALFDLDGNGALDSDEFKRAARQLHTLLEALEDVPAKQALSAPRS